MKKNLSQVTLPILSHILYLLNNKKALKSTRNGLFVKKHIQKKVKFYRRKFSS